MPSLFLSVGFSFNANGLLPSVFRPVPSISNQSKPSLLFVPPCFRLTETIFPESSVTVNPVSPNASPRYKTISFLPSLFAFRTGAVLSVLTVITASAGSSSVELSGYLTVTFPVASTVISAFSGRSLFLFFTACFTAAFSSSLRLFGLPTTTLVSGAFKSAVAVFLTGVDSFFALSVKVTVTSDLSFTLSPGSVIVSP